MGSMRNTLLFAVLVGVSLGLAYFLYSPSEPPISESGIAPSDQDRFYPELRGRVDQITQVQVGTAERHYQFVKSASGWLEGPFGYPTQGSVVDALLQSVAGLDKVEPKTSNPAFYPKIGVDKKDVSTGGSFRVGFLVGDTKIADFILGTERQVKNKPSGQWFVRKAGVAESWLVEGRLNLRSNVSAWLDTRAFPLDPAQLTKLIVHEGKQGDLVLERQEGNQWKVVSMPVAYKNQKIEQPEMIEANLMQIEFTSLKALDELKLPEAPDWLVELYLKNGEGLRMEVFNQPDSLYARLSLITTDASATSETAKSLAPYLQAWKKAALAFSKEKMDDLMQTHPAAPQ